MATIALYGTRVIPRVRELLDGEEAATANVEPASA
jgi:hypothetical protein